MTPATDSVRRIRFRALTIAVVLALPAAFLTVSTAGPAGAAEPCQGQQPTLVGVPGQPLTGTDGPDVIVANGALRVDALGGDDLVCVDGGTSAVNTGAGADTVTGTTGGFGELGLWLGAGPDTADLAGPRVNYVDAGDWDDLMTGQPAAHDVVSVRDNRRGKIHVRSGQVGQLNTDEVTVAGGRAKLWLSGLLNGRWVVSRGILHISESTPHAWRLDARSGTGSVDGRTFVADGFQRYDFMYLAWTSLNVVGSSRNEEVDVQRKLKRLERGDVDVRLHGGEDRLVLDDHLRGSARLDGGRGRDQVVLQRGGYPLKGRVSVDMSRSIRTPDHRVASLRSVENLHVGSFRLATVRGSRVDNTISAFGCAARLTGGAGQDRLILRGSGSSLCARGGSGLVASGGPGDDRLVGTPWRDRLLGGAGRDQAHGFEGRDVCRAEVRRKCEA